VLICHLYFIFWELSIYFICHLLIGLFDLLLSIFISLCFLDINPLNSLYIFFLILWVVSSFLWLLSLMYTRFLIWYNHICQFWLLIISWAIEALSRKPLIMHSYNFKYFPMFYYSSFKVTTFILRALIHLSFFVQVRGRRSSFSLLHMDIQFSNHHLLKKLSSLQSIFWAPSSEIRWVDLFLVLLT
jgi:hypothetical protein